jgi:ElaB/YqjD/DUF883 family membrane-anchored ribosome-binding protein
MNDHERITNDPARIEREIVHTRESLHRKLEELQHRLSPRERVRAAVERIDPRPYTGIAALAAVGVGTVMAVSGWRRSRTPNGLHDPADMMGE